MSKLLRSGFACCWIGFLCAVAVAEETESAAVKLRRALATRQKIPFAEATLDEIAETIRSTYGVNVYLDHLGLTRAGVDEEAEISFYAEHATLAEALSLLLEPQALAWTVEDGTLVITSAEEDGPAFSTTEVYEVKDFVQSVRGEIDAGALDPWIELFQAAIEPDSWAAMGGAGSVAPFGTTLIVSQTGANHRQVARLLEALRRARRASVQTLPEIDAFQQALEAPLTLLASDLPLTELAEVLRRECDLDVYVDREGIDGAGGSSDATLSGDFDRVPLADVLDELLREKDLAWMRRFGALVITSQETAESAVHPVVYDLRELTTPKAGEKSPLGYGAAAHLLVAALPPASWNTNGGPGAIAIVDNLAVISQTSANHERLRRTLAAIAVLRRDSSRGIALANGGELPRVRCNFQETPMSDAMAHFARLTEMPIVLDKRALAEAEIDAFAPVSVQLDDTPLDEALDLTLRGLDLTWHRTGNAIRITTHEAAARNRVFRLYFVGDLLGSNKRNASARTLRESILATVAPESWEEMGGPGAVVEAGDFIAIANSQQVHRRVARLLDQLRAPFAGGARRGVTGP